jgi:hypothetical protein
MEIINKVRYYVIDKAYELATSKVGRYFSLLFNAITGRSLRKQTNLNNFIEGLEDQLVMLLLEREGLIKRINKLESQSSSKKTAIVAKSKKKK